VSGELQEEFSHLSEILICCDYSNIDSIGLLQPVDDSDVKIYKIFSNKILHDKRDENLAKFFANYKIHHKIKWFAYPNYENKFLLVGHPKFELAQGIYHINATESAASAMEMESIGAKNVARLVYEKFYG